MKSSVKQLSLFELELTKTNPETIVLPKGYKGLAAFHKYWGKKPIECLAFLIENLTEKGDIVLDPFLGSGLVAREAVIRERRLIGIDINPVAVELSNLLVNLPNPDILKKALDELEISVKSEIYKTYLLEDGKFATHYLWNKNELNSVWHLSPRRNESDKRIPTNYDYQVFKQFEGYEPKIPRPLKLFQNSRINTNDTLTLKDLFTGRALYNIDLLLDAIHKQPNSIKSALLLSLTSASGQMSKMVFAITGRGKTKSEPTNKIEVGSWVIGYWRPTLHFEINVWNCFIKRANSLLKSIQEDEFKKGYCVSKRLTDVIDNKADVAIFQGDNRKILNNCPDETISLILTDPPHSDRIPYLELSEMWNCLIHKEPDFSQEIVVSNARIRGKNKNNYVNEMMEFMQTATRILKPGGILALFFNARDADSWQFLKEVIPSDNQLQFRGLFPMNYSANSVIQDSRKGGLKNDFVLIYQKPGNEDNIKLISLEKLPNWSKEIPNIPSK
ncbi:MAG: DNA methyltransferase [Dolichospermum sp.]|jgi:16S rRNA G966 N2-methylase RsmD|nr:type II modification methylase [Dolichospermum circinale Clear-D4]